MFAARNMMFAGGFSPLSLSPALWLSDTGSDASTWSDLSGNGRHATQATAAKQPAIVTGALNGRQVRRFDGVNDNMIHGMSGSITSCTIFAVFKKNTEQTLYRGIVAIGPNAPNGSMMLSRVDSNKWGSYGGGNTSANSDTGTSSFNVYGMVDNGAAGGLFYRNGAADGTWATNTDGQTAAHVGGMDNSQAASCDIAEILVFPTALSTENRQKVERYLGSKWGIAVS